MAGPHAADEAGIRQLIDKMAEAIRAMDFEGLKACFAPDMVSFDVAGPPLQTVGADAKLKNWEMAFTDSSRRRKHRAIAPAVARRNVP